MCDRLCCAIQVGGCRVQLLVRSSRQRRDFLVFSSAPVGRLRLVCGKQAAQLVSSLDRGPVGREVLLELQGERFGPSQPRVESPSSLAPVRCQCPYFIEVGRKTSWSIDNLGRYRVDGGNCGNLDRGLRSRSAHLRPILAQLGEQIVGAIEIDVERCQPGLDRKSVV